MQLKTNSPIKQGLMTAFITLLTFTTLTYVSCKKDKCKDVTCQNGGSCNDGNCSCATGYSGTNCETPDNAKFVGTWTGTDCLGNPATVTISAGSNGATIIFPGTIGANSCYKAISIPLTISGNTASCSAETYTDLCGNIYSFTGTNATITGNSIHINIVANYVSAGGSDSNCFNGTR